MVDKNNPLYTGWLSSEPIHSLENFKEAIEEVLSQCGRMPAYKISSISGQASNQIVLEAVYDDLQPQRVIITLEEI